MKALTFYIEQEQDGGFIAEAQVNEQEQIITQADSVEELREMIKDALTVHFESPLDVPKTIILNFVRQEILAI